MRRLYRCRAKGRALTLLVLAFSASSAAGQERIAIEQVQVRAQRSAGGTPGAGIQESDYILGAQSGIMLLNPGYQIPSASAAANQARSLQIGAGNVATIDQSGSTNIAIQNVIGAQNTVTQTQVNDGNRSSVFVQGNSNTVGTQQDGSRASAAVTVLGNNNAITTQQSASDTGAISITRIGNGPALSVTRR